MRREGVLEGAPRAMSVAWVEGSETGVFWGRELMDFSGYQKGSIDHAFLPAEFTVQTP